MAKESILVIEDEKNIVELVQYNLEQEGYAVRSAMDGDVGLKEALKGNIDLLILDLMLPGIDGLEICKTLKQNPKTLHIPIIILSAKAQDADQIVGLELGADDYVTKPFSPRQLVARVKAVLRRSKDKPKDVATLTSGAVEINVGKHLVTLQAKPLELTSKEYHLLKILVESGGNVLSREFLLSRVWGHDRSAEIETRTVDAHINQLRKKLKSEANRILTVINAGYRWNNED